MLTSPWNQDDSDQPRRNKIFRKVLSVDGPSESATLGICGLGHYELYLNGARVGDCQLEPNLLWRGCTSTTLGGFAHIFSLSEKKVAGGS